MEAFRRKLPDCLMQCIVKRSLSIKLHFDDATQMIDEIIPQRGNGDS